MEDIRSRAQIIIDELECGGFAECELEDVIDICYKEIEKISENE